MDSVYDLEGQDVFNQDSLVLYLLYVSQAACISKVVVYSAG